MQAIRGGRAAADHRNAKPARRGGVAFRHRHRLVLVLRAAESDTDRIERSDEHRSVVAHQAEYRLNAQPLVVVGENPVHRDSMRGCCDLPCLRDCCIHVSPPLARLAIALGGCGFRPAARQSRSWTHMLATRGTKGSSIIAR